MFKNRLSKSGMLAVSLFSVPFILSTQSVSAQESTDYEISSAEMIEEVEEVSVNNEAALTVEKEIETNDESISQPESSLTEMNDKSEVEVLTTDPEQKVQESETITNDELLDETEESVTQNIESENEEIDLPELIEKDASLSNEQIDLDQPMDITAKGNNIPSPKKYAVTYGDTLYRIAKNNGVTVGDLKEWNNLSSNTIYSGTQLIVSKPQFSSNVAQTSPAVQKSMTYTVTPGDYLYKIAKKFNVTVDDIKRWNQLKSNVLYSGTILKVAAPSQTKSTEEPSTSEVTNTTYTVSRGDTLYRIALKHNISLGQLRKWNNISTNLIKPGQKLIVSQTTNAATSSTNQPEKPKSKPKVEVKTKPAEIYTVVRGDTLYKISQRNNISLNQLRKLNNISGNLITPGQRLIVSSEPKNTVVKNKSTENKSETRQSNVTNPKVHVIQSGDTLYNVSQRYGVTVSQLKTWNNLKSNWIPTNQHLIVSNPNLVTPRKTSQVLPSKDPMVAGYKQLDVPLLSQFDPAWKNHRYGNDVSRTIWENGCAIVSLAMIDSYLSGEHVSPATIADWAGLDHYVWGVGTAWSAFPAFAKYRGYNISNHGRNVDSALRAIQNGSVGLVSVKPGHFINGGHIMVLRGYDQGSVFVNDPYDNPHRQRKNSFIGHSAQYLRNDAVGLWTFSK